MYVSGIYGDIVIDINGVEVVWDKISFCDGFFDKGG